MFDDEYQEQLATVGGAKAVAWAHVAEEFLDPASDVPEPVRELVWKAAEANLRGDANGMMGPMATMYQIFQQASPDDSPAGIVQGLMTLIEIFGAYQSAAGNMRPIPPSGLILP